MAVTRIPLPSGGTPAGARPAFVLAVEATQTTSRGLPRVTLTVEVVENDVDESAVAAARRQIERLGGGSR